MPINVVRLSSKPIGKSYRLPCVKSVPSSHMVSLENEIRESLNQNEARRSVTIDLASQFTAR